MKKGFFLTALAASLLMLTGCGDGGSSSSGISGSGGELDTPARNTVEVETTVSEQEVAATTPRNLYGISEKIGMPPALPAQ